jgi:hypothetical protein
MVRLLKSQRMGLTDHVEGSEREVVAVKIKRLVPDVDVQVVATPRVGDAATIGHRHAQTSTTLQHDSCSGCSIGVHKIVGGTRIKLGKEAGTFDDDWQLHHVPQAQLYAGEGVERNYQIASSWTSSLVSTNSSITSIMNNHWHNSLWPCEK